MSLVSSGVGEVQLKTLMTAIDGFCTSLKGSTFLNDLFNRAQNFSRGYATSGEVPTFIVALGDQLALLWGYKHGCQLQGNILDISSFSTTQYWRTLFFRILRDKFDGMFTAYCTPNDPDGDSKRRQKEIDAEDTIEFLVQGFNTTTDPYGLLNQSMVSPDWKSYFQKVGAYSIDPKHRTELNLDSIKLSVTTLDEGIDLCTFFEEETLDNLTTFHEPSPSLTVIDEKEQSISNSIETISLPSNIEDLISSLLDFKRKLPERGHPSSLLTDEQVVDGDGSNGGKSHITPYRKYFILQIIKSLSRELQYLVKSSIHMVYQLSEGQCSIDEPNPTTIFDLLGIEPNQEGFLWLLSQIILAIKLRTNSRYRADLEKYHASTTTAATTSTSMIPPSETELLEGGESTSSFLSFNPLQLLNKLNIQYTNKQIQHYEELQKIRIRNLQQKYRRIYLSAPGNTSYSPLRIYSEKHLLKINNWILKYRNYQIRRTMSPITNSYTSMAKNTYLTPLNRYFMTECNPYHICSIIYGNSSERSFLLYYEHLHTFSSRIINNLYNPTDDESTSTSSGKNVLEDIQKFQKYRQLFYEHYGPTHPFDDKNEIVLLDVWISFSFDYLLNQLSSSRYDNDVTSTSNSMRIQEYSDKLYQYLYEFYTGTSSSSGSGTTTSTTSIPPIPPGASGVITSRLSSQIKLELLWHTNPEEYLNDYFTSQRFEERISMKPSLEEYLHLIATSGSRIRGNEMEEVIEDDLELAKKVYFEEYAIDMEINRNALIG